ncbi:MAG: carbohydrate kinase family protein [Gemmatimonadales bacterium]
MKRLGALGTMVWDTIHARDPVHSEPVEEWGGICYGFSAFEAAAPDGWELLPIVKVGANLRERANAYLSSLSRVGSLDGVLTVQEANNEVEIVYGDCARRCETLKGGVPGWTWEELEPLARTCDALYVNFIAGWELDLHTAQQVRKNHRGPLYCDLHSIFLGVGSGGVREPRPLTEWREWLRCFDLVQVNEDEPCDEPWPLAADIVGEEIKALFVTLGERGAAWVAESGFDGLTSETGAPAPGSAQATSALAAAPRVVRQPDPTGCGDVWGMTCFASLLGGSSLRAAAERANELAARSAEHRGASRLGPLLAGSTSTLEPRARTS